ncbi:hypothetical protein U9M48_023135, partial [Paspalum notatum var. saurae]
MAVEQRCGQKHRSFVSWLRPRPCPRSRPGPTRILLAVRADPLDLALVEQEPKAHLLASGASRHVVALHVAFEDADAVHLMLDLCAGGDHFSALAACGPLPEPEVARLAAQLADVLAGCYRRGVAHRDVKPDNLFFSSSSAGGADGGEGDLRLGDFGSAGWFGDGRPMTGLVGTPYYVAPEVVAGQEYTEKVDVWSAGVVLYLLLSGTVPFYAPPPLRPSRPCSATTCDSRRAPSPPSRPRPRTSCAACSAGTPRAGSPPTKSSGTHGLSPAGDLRWRRADSSHGHGHGASHSSDPSALLLLGVLPEEERTSSVQEKN